MSDGRHIADLLAGELELTGTDVADPPLGRLKVWGSRDGINGTIIWFKMRGSYAYASTDPSDDPLQGAVGIIAEEPGTAGNGIVVELVGSDRKQPLDLHWDRTRRRARIQLATRGTAIAASASLPNADPQPHVTVTAVDAGYAGNGLRVDFIAPDEPVETPFATYDPDDHTIQDPDRITVTMAGSPNINPTATTAQSTNPNADLELTDIADGQNNGMTCDLTYTATRAAVSGFGPIAFKAGTDYPGVAGNALQIELRWSGALDDHEVVQDVLAPSAVFSYGTDTTFQDFLDYLDANDDVRAAIDYDHEVVEDYSPAMGNGGDTGTLTFGGGEDEHVTVSILSHGGTHYGPADSPTAVASDVRAWLEDTFDGVITAELAEGSDGTGKMVDANHLTFAGGVPAHQSLSAAQLIAAINDDDDSAAAVTAEASGDVGEVTFDDYLGAQFALTGGEDRGSDETTVLELIAAVAAHRDLSKVLGIMPMGDGQGFDHLSNIRRGDNPDYIVAPSDPVTLEDGDDDSIYDGTIFRD